jgi:prepilin-type processing-associated H-X9-DG protein
VHQCPSFSGAHNWFADPYTGYNYNTSYIGMNETVSPPNSARTTEVGQPSKTAIFGDGQYSAGANKFMRAPFSNPRDASFSDPGRAAGTQGYRHLDRTNVAFCDGHTESWEDLFTDTDPIGQEALDTYNRTHDEKIGFLSKDNEYYDLN